MTPGGMLALTICLTGGAAFGERIGRRRRHQQFQRLAATWKMQFNGRDQLRLASRVARNFPIPGAANLRVRDVIYGTQGERYRYIFTAEYTIGVMRTKHRRSRAATFAEARDHRQAQRPETVLLASAELPLLAQYQQLALASLSTDSASHAGLSPIKEVREPKG